MWVLEYHGAYGTIQHYLKNNLKYKHSGTYSSTMVLGTTYPTIEMVHMLASYHGSMYVHQKVVTYHYKYVRTRVVHVYVRT